MNTRTDTAELRRLLADGEAAPIRWAQNAAAIWNVLPAMIDELEAASLEMRRQGSVIAELREDVRRMTQANGDLRTERDRAVAEAQRQDRVAKGLRAELAKEKANASLVGTWEQAARKAAAEDGVQFVGPNTIFAVSDKLRAELAAAKKENATMRATIISAMVDVQHNLPGNGHAKLSLLLDGIMKAPKNNEERLLAERTALAAHVERLEKALKMWRVIPFVLAEFGDHGELAALSPVYYHNSMSVTKEALAATPAQSLAAHDAALLREVAGEVKQLIQAGAGAISVGRNGGIADAFQLISAKADRIVKEAANG